VPRIEEQKAILSIQFTCTIHLWKRFL